MSSHLSDPISDNAASVWPKRASKACASCRRDKIRCDGARPCGGCAKKGYAAEECTDGCEACRRARVRCEGGKPCQRCVEMKFESCNDTGTSISGQRPLTPPPPNRTSRGGDRAKLACSSCRRDNKKCDDQRPCSRCVARGEECIHIGRGPKLVKLRCEGCRDTKKRCEDTRPCRYCIESFKQCVIVPRKGRGHGTRVKAACMSCRRDKIRCNGDRPCASCAKKGCECVERACQACSREGKVAECPHRKTQDSGFSDSGGEPAIPPEREYKLEASFQIMQPSLAHPSHSRDRNQWPSFSTGFQSHPSQQMYSSLSANHQYFFPPHFSNQSEQTSFLPMHRGYPGNDIQPSQQYYYSTNSGNYALPSSNRTLPYNN